MSIAKWLNEGENRVLNILLGAQPVDGTLWLGLYKNTEEPAETVTLADMNEPAGFGYARKALTRGYWTIIDDYALYLEQTFLAQGGAWGNIYGYFICTVQSGTSGKLLALEHLDSPLNIEDGKGIKVVPKITCA
ncbi:MAG: hypothetical protein AB1491_00070 [Thermodesulfobacteriota bacterium]